MTCSANAAPVVSENVINPVSSHNRVPDSIGRRIAAPIW
jgi:hypothetical protein